MESNSKDSPTWYDPVKDLFRKKDRACMLERFDLAKYEDVKKNASHIYGVLKNKWMPMGGPYWSDEQLLVLETWIKNGCPMGEPKNTPSRFLSLFSLEKGKESKVTAARIRKNLNELGDNDIKKLKLAFDGIKKLPKDDPNSFFHLASFHGLPNPIWCWHHFFGFLPWHRYYVLIFENALRTIKGCEDVTLPYWDLVSEKPLPEWIWQDPFDSFTYPIDMPSDDPQVGPSTNHPKTIRASYKYVTNATVISRYRNWVGESMKTSTWEDFADYQNPAFGYRVALEKTHDSIHNLTGGVLSDHPDGIEIPAGGDMAFQEFTAFDPIFWFFHNGIDRYCWEWQKQRDAKDVIGLTKTFRTGSLSDLYLKQPLNPWLSETFEKYVNLETVKVGNDLGIDYTPGSFSRDDSLLLRLTSLPKSFISPSESFSISPQYIVSIKSVNRTFIQGSFSVLLYYHDGNNKVIIGSESCFQPQNPMRCKGCNEKPILDFGFLVSKDLIDKKFCFEIHTLDQKVVSLHRVGSPFIQITSTIQSF